MNFPINKVIDFNLPSILFDTPKVVNEIELNNQIQKLNQFKSILGKGDFVFNDSNSIPFVIKKFKLSLVSNTNFSLIPKELRVLTYGLTYTDKKNGILTSIFDSENELIKALSLLENNWRDGFITGLLECCLSNWECTNINSLLRVHQFLIQKLNNYEGNRVGLIQLKGNLRFLNIQNGNILLGNDLAIQRKELQQASNYLFNFHKESFYYQSYFSKVILSYYEKRKDELELIFNDLQLVLSWHYSKKTSQILISKIILSCEYENQHLQDDVKDLALKFVGDPDNISTWLPHSGVSIIEKEIILNAKDVLNQWIISQFINVFFEKCINDKRRKAFWLKMTPHINAFKVFGSPYVKEILLSDERIAKFVEARFVNVGYTSKVSAFFMHVKDYKFIEFSDPGWAFYAYKIKNTYSPQIDGYYSKMEDLRNGNLPFLVTINGYKIRANANEGRLRHADGDLIWEDVFKYWINNNLGLNV